MTNKTKIGVKEEEDDDDHNEETLRKPVWRRGQKHTQMHTYIQKRNVFGGRGLRKCGNVMGYGERKISQERGKKSTI